MTIDLPADRPIPDEHDLRLLGELINNVSIPLANAAWNAQLSQAEAAARLVSMAERGLPLRLVADGDRQALWHIAQQGPATAAPPLPVPAPAPPATPAVPQVPYAEPGVPAEPLPASDPAGPPPSETAQSGDLAAAGESHPGLAADVVTADDPLGGGAGAPIPANGDDAPVDPGAGGAAFGVMGAAAASGAAAAAPEDVIPTAGASEHSGAMAAPDSAEHTATVPGGAADTGPAAAPETPSATAPAASGRWAEQVVQGPAGEVLHVSILDIADPANEQLAAIGFQVPPEQRAILVHSQVRNSSQVPYPIPGDLNLVLEDSQHTLLGRAGISLPTHPAFAPNVGPEQTERGWSVFLIPAPTVVAGIKWCIRPDITSSILSWPI